MTDWKVGPTSGVFAPVAGAPGSDHRRIIEHADMASAGELRHHARMCEAQPTFDAILTSALGRWDLKISDDQLRRLRDHFEAVVETNRTINLTRITDPAESAIKHYADSLALLVWARERAVDVGTVLDIGTGAGFPSLPLAVMRPDWSVTAIDATRKKIEFLQRTAAAIGLANLHCEQAHSQHWRPGRRFQLVVSRALTALSRTLGQAVGHLARPGWLVLYKTAAQVRNEREDAKRLSAKLGIHLRELYAYDLQTDDETLCRVLYVYHSGPGAPGRRDDR